MKKVLSVLVVAILVLSCMLPMTASAVTASATLAGAGTVRAGDTITLTFNLNGKGIYGAEGTLNYDAAQVSLVSTSQKIASPWVVEFNGNKFVAYDNNLAAPISSNKAVFSVTFKVKAVATGTKINISYTGVKASDGTADANIGTVSYSATVAAPLSTENNLASLTVAGVTLSPAFSAGTTSYTTTVPFSTSKLNVTATAKDSKAKVTVNSPNLVPGGKTNVTVTVKAENGSTKTYTIVVSREQDPNYVASANNNLSGISVEGFLLSPVFSADKTSYIVWAPYETESVKVTGTAADTKASVEVVGGENLAAGQDNEVKVVCTAENGDKKTYTVVVKRAAAHDGTTDAPIDTPNDDVNTDNPELTGGIAWWWILVASVLSLGLGFSAAFVLLGSKKRK